LSVVSGFTCPGVHLSGVQLSGFTCPKVHLFGGSLVRTFVCYNFLVRVRHSKGPPLPGCASRFNIQTFRSHSGDTSLYNTTQQVNNAIYFTVGQHRYHSAGQQRNTDQATLNHNLTEIKIQGKTRGTFRHNTPAAQHRPCIYFSRTASPWEW